MQLQTNNTVLALIDIQNKLTAVMHDREQLCNQLVKLTQGAIALDIPIIIAEQNPTRMGQTIPQLASLLNDHQPIAKMSFSCCGSPEWLTTLKSTERQQVIIAGIETHVCVAQTAIELMQQAFKVVVPVDCVSSRHELDHQTALTRIQQAANITHSPIPVLSTVEAILFELMQSAEAPAFKQILKIVR